MAPGHTATSEQRNLVQDSSLAPREAEISRAGGISAPWEAADFERKPSWVLGVAEIGAQHLAGKG